MSTALGKQSLASLMSVLVLAIFAVATPLVAQTAKKDKPPAENPKDAVTALRIVVTGGPQDKPVDNASVYLHWDEHRFLRHAKQMEFDLKTDLKGVAVVKDVPRVRILIQVVKDGWKPYGRYYDLDKDQEEIAIKLEPPSHWY